MSQPLRKCRICGLEALSEKDLELFVKRKKRPYGREAICKKCQSNYKKKYRDEHIEQMRAYSKKYYEENKEKYNLKYKRKIQRILNSFGSPILCYFCGKEITKLKGTNKDSIALHSLDGDHDNWNPNNKVPAHFACHERYHHVGEQHYNWQGDLASKAAKRQRRLRRKYNKDIDKFFIGAMELST